jgi:hypothetical protein
MNLNKNYILPIATLSKLGKIQYIILTLYTSLRACPNQLIAGLTSSCLQTEVKDHLVSLGTI